MAKATEMQLQFSVTLLRRAVANLTALRYGVEPGVVYASTALGEAEKALACTEEMIRNIPE